MGLRAVTVAQTEELHIDSVKFVREGARLQGEVPVSGLPRLSEGLVQSEGALGYELTSAQDARGRPVLKLSIRGSVALTCQRCLEPMAWEVDLASVVRPVAPEVLEKEYEDNPDEPDCIAHDKALDVAALIEDEVLLALPAYPRHAEGQCAARASVVQSGAKVLAFNALAALKQKH